MEFSWNFVLCFISFIFTSSSQDILPDLRSLDLFGDHPMDVGALLPKTLVKDSQIPTSLLSSSNSNTSNPEYGVKEQTKVVSISAAKPVMKKKTVFSMKNAEVVETKQTVGPTTSKPTEQTYPNSTFVDYPTLPERDDIIPKPNPPSTSLPRQSVKPSPSIEPISTQSSTTVKETKVGSRVLHEFLPQNMLESMQGQSTTLNRQFKDSFNIAESSVLLSDVFNKPWNKQGLTGDSYILKNRLKSMKHSKKRRNKPSTTMSTFDHLTSLLKRENTLLNIALGLITKDKNLIKDSLKKKSRCPYKPYSLDRRYFMEKVKDGGWMKRRCALGTAYDQETCECSIYVGYQPVGCTPEMVMDFNNGLIEDQSENKIPSGVEGVVSLSDLGYFSGAGRIIFWRYTNFDFQHSIGLKFRFKSESKIRGKPHPLITNCGTGMDEPSFGVILNSFSDVLTFFVKTTKSEIKFLTFKIKPMEWNDVIYTYDGEHLIGKVNNMEKRVSVKGNIEIRSAEMTLGHCERYGWFKGFMDDVKIYSCVPKEV